MAEARVTQGGLQSESAGQSAEVTQGGLQAESAGALARVTQGGLQVEAIRRVEAQTTQGGLNAEAAGNKAEVTQAALQVEARFVPPPVEANCWEFHVYNRIGTHLAILDGATARGYLAQLNDTGSGQFDIHEDDADATAAILSPWNIVKVRYRNVDVGGFLIESIRRPQVTAAEHAGRVFTVSGRGRLASLSKGIVYPSDIGDANTVNRDFTAVTRASIFLTLNTEFTARGGGDLTPDFTAALDSDGIAWGDSNNLSFKAGTQLLDVLKQLAGFGTDFTVDHDGTLHARPAEGADLSATVIFREGHDLVDVEYGQTVSDQANAVLGEGQDILVESTSAGDIATYGRREGYLPVQNTADAGQIGSANSALLGQLASPLQSYKVTVRTEHYRPFIDYNLGDTVRVVVPGRLDGSLRILAIGISERSGPCDLEVVLTVNTLELEHLIKMDKVLRASRQNVSFEGTVRDLARSDTRPQVHVEPGGGGGITANLDDLGDVTLTGPIADNEVLAYDTATGEWLNQTAAEAGLAAATHNHDGTYVRIAAADTISAVHTFNPVAPGAPFLLGVNASGQLVTGLNADLLDGLHAAAFALSGHTHRLDEITNPTADKTFTMVDRHLKFTWTNPVVGGGFDGAYEIEATGNFGGDLLHVHQHTGAPAAGTHLIHAEADHVNVHALHISHDAVDANALAAHIVMAHASATAVRVEVSGDTNPRFTASASGVLSWGPGNAALDTNLYRSAANVLRTDDAFAIGGAAASGYMLTVIGKAFTDRVGDYGWWVGSYGNWTEIPAAIGSLGIAADVLTQNARYDVGDARWEFVSTGHGGRATAFGSYVGSFYWYNAAGATAPGDPITWVLRTVLNTAGGLTLYTDAATAVAFRYTDNTNYTIEAGYALAGRGYLRGAGGTTLVLGGNGGNIMYLTDAGVGINTSGAAGMRLAITAGATGALNLIDTGGTSVGGIIFGTDTTLYRDAAASLFSNSKLTLSPASSAVHITLATPNAGYYAELDANFSLADTFHINAVAAAASYQVLQATNTGLFLRGSVASATYFQIGAGVGLGVAPVANILLAIPAGTTAAINLTSTAGTAAGGLLFGTDVTLYRSAANVLKTDDDFHAIHAGAVVVRAESSDNEASYYLKNALREWRIAVDDVNSGTWVLENVSASLNAIVAYYNGTMIFGNGATSTAPSAPRGPFQFLGRVTSEDATAAGFRAIYATSDYSTFRHDINGGFIETYDGSSHNIMKWTKAGNIGFFGAAAVAKPTVSGAKGGNAALGSLMTALSSLGLVTDSTTA